VPTDDRQETERWRGTEATLRWQVGIRTALLATAQLARRRSTFNVVNDELRAVNIQLDKEIGRRATMSVGLIREQDESQQDLAAPTGDYKQTLLTVSLRRRFGAAGESSNQRYTEYVGAGQAR
jgi:hypothetical protein